MQTLLGRRHRLWLILGAITVALGLAGAAAVRVVALQVQEHTLAHLRLILDGTTQMLENLFEGLSEQARFVATSRRVQDEASGPWPAAGAAVATELAALVAHGKALGFVLTDLSDRPLHQSAPELAAALPSLDFAGDPALDVRISLPKLLPAPAASASGEAPLVLAVVLAIQDAAGTPRARLWLFHDARAAFASILHPGRSGTTGEIYAFDRSGTMISDSRFNEHLYTIGLLAERQEASGRITLRDPLADLTTGERSPRARTELPFTKAVASATAGREDHDLEGFRDYRGVPVVGTWRWLERYGMGVTHEIDKLEAYFNVNVLIAVTASLIGTLFAATVASALLSWRIALVDGQRRQSQQRLKDLQTEVAHVGRLATMGEMATGLAHELNQPLAAISNYARAAINELESGEVATLRDRLAQIERQALRSGEIIHRLRRFVTRRVVQAAPVKVASLLQDPLALLDRDLRSLDVTLDVDVPADLPLVHGDEVQLQQVVLNLVRNSVEAMRRTPGRRHRLGVRAYLSPDADARVALEVSDTGPGIDAKIRQRLFEQFNSSNPQGMGMGLAISRTIVESHGGRIELSKDAPDGTTFTLRLPVSGADVGAAVSEAS